MNNLTLNNGWISVKNYLTYLRRRRTHETRRIEKGA